MGLVNSRGLWATVVMALALGHAPARAQESEPMPVQVASSTATLHPGDVVQIRIWREPDLGGEFLVGANGTVTLPMIGEQRVTGIPLDRLQAQLIERYRVNLRNVAITINPLRRVQVLGQVNRPGIFNVDPTLSLTGVMALAGGANSQGDLRRIRVVRDGEVLRERVSVGESLSALDVRSGDQLYVGDRSWVDRNSAFLVGALISTFTAITTTLIVN